MQMAIVLNAKVVSAINVLLHMLIMYNNNNLLCCYCRCLWIL